MGERDQLLRDYLSAVRRALTRRELWVLAVDLALLIGGSAVLLIGLVGWTLRGDLGAAMGLPTAAAGAAALAVARLRALRRHARSPLSVARAIAGARGPLRARATADEHEHDAILRHELLGATELAVALELDGDAGPRSPELAARYTERLGAATLDLDPRLATARRARVPRMLAAVVLAASLGGLAASEVGARGLELLLNSEDGRPPAPPRPVWSSLELELDYPAHTRRATRRVPNPSGTLRVPAGTRVGLDMVIAEPAAAVRVVLTYDGTELAAAPAPEVIELEATGDQGDDALRYRGEVVVRGAGSWVVALLDRGDDDDARALRVADRRSPAMRLELEADAAPEVELAPLPAEQREASETDRVELRFLARDDFGLSGAELVYEFAVDPNDPTAEPERRRLVIGEAPRRARSWRERYSWDLSAIPLEDRSRVSYWIEVRDNDPGLGLGATVDGERGKVGASARQQLFVRDDEAEHAANIRDLQALRDAAVDLLAARLTSEAFSSGRERGRALEGARELHQQAAMLLTLLAASVDALAMDTMVAERDVTTLAAIHARLLELHRREAELHATVPPDAELKGDAKLAKLLAELERHNKREVSQLEDEIIRLDDLVDGQIIARIEALVARLQASQQKLVEKLEQLAAGDESVRPAVEQLEQRIREDLRRVQEARAQLRKEVGDEWMNVDAFKAMQARMRSQALLEQLRRGDVDGALEQAREGLEAIRRMRDELQRHGADEPTPALSEEDRKRMQLLRELSRLQDEQTGVRGQTRRLYDRWRESVAPRRAEDEARADAGRRAKRLRERLDAINDARLSREGRAAWEDAREALRELEQAAAAEGGEPGEAPSQLELFEAARAAAEATARAQRGAEAKEAEGRALQELARETEALRRRLREPLPDADETLTPEQIDELTQLAQRQQALRERSQRLGRDPMADILPEAGRTGLQQAEDGMNRARQSLDDAALEGALSGEQRARQGIQRAIDSLRDSSPPPPPQSSSGDASTEAERDRSLRDQVVEAMREGDRDGFDDDTKRYYEELLR